MSRTAVSNGRFTLGARSRARRLRRAGVLAAATAATAALGAATLAGPALADTPSIPSGAANYTLHRLDDQADPTFNQLLGINDSGLIAGYFGSGQPGHPNKGYELTRGHQQGDFRDENFPHSAQTQVTGLNNRGVSVGFWVDGKGDNFGFYAVNGRYFRNVPVPEADPASPQVDQLLGVNDGDVAVGFYTDKAGTNHGYTYDLRHHRLRWVNVAGDTSVTAAAINDLGDVAGFATDSAGTTVGYLHRSDGRVITLQVPGASATQALGVNNGDEVVGDYTVGSGNDAVTHGFTWSPGFGFETVDDPSGPGGTTINGVNDRGDLVGFSVDANGNTNGLLATP